MRKWNSERGMSLVEATIILMVLAVLTAVLAPSIGDYVNDARDTKAKEDVEALGTAVMRAARDAGYGGCLMLSTPATGGCERQKRADALTSAGASPIVTAADWTPATGTVIWNGSWNWDGDADAFNSDQADTFDRQLITNAAGYALPTGAATAGPRGGIGWRGAYISGSIGPDPWGHKYQANTVFLGVASDNANAGTLEGQRSASWQHDAMVISAGRNGIMETAFAVESNGSTNIVGDDVVYVMSGSTR